MVLEARLLDEREWVRWLGLWAPDSRYVMPVRSVALAGDGPDRPVAEEFTGPGELHYFDETRDVLAARVAKLRTGTAWAEEPPSLTTRLITNVLLDEDEPGRDGAGGDEVVVLSNFLVHRSRGDVATEQFVGSRRDRLRVDGDGWSIVRRDVRLNAGVLRASNLELFL